MRNRASVGLLVLAFAVVASGADAAPLGGAIQVPPAKQVEGAFTKLHYLKAVFPDVSMVVGVKTDAGYAGLVAAPNFQITENGIAQSLSNFKWIPGLATTDKLDFILAFDISGSMGPYIEAMKQGCADLAESVLAFGLDVQFALVTFRDVAQIEVDLTDDVSRFVSVVNMMDATEGDEDVLDAVMLGLNGLNRRPDAQPVFLVVTDEPADYRGSGAEPCNYQMPEVVAALTQADAITFMVSWDFNWIPLNPIPWNDYDPRTLVEATKGHWEPIEGANQFSVFLGIVANEMLPSRYEMAYRTRNTRSDGQERRVRVQVTDPIEGVASDTGSYIAPFIHDPDFRGLTYAFFGGVGYTTEDPHITLAGTVDYMCTALLVNGSTEGLNYSVGAQTWSYAGMLSPGENMVEVVSLDMYANAYGPLTAKFIYNPNPNLTLISMSATDETLNLYDTIRVEGELGVQGGTQELLMGRIVRVRYERLGFEPVDQYTVTDETGHFIDSYRAEGLGVWTVRAKFDGDADLKESGWSDPEAVVTVARGSDVDESGKVDSIDVQLVINEALGLDISPMSADGNGDGQTDATDVQMTINAALAL